MVDSQKTSTPWREPFGAISKWTQVLCNSAHGPSGPSDWNLFTWVERDTVRVNWPVQEHSAQYSRPVLKPGVAHAKHEAAASLSRTLYQGPIQLKLLGIKVINDLRSFSWVDGSQVNSARTKVLSHFGGNQNFHFWPQAAKWVPRKWSLRFKPRKKNRFIFMTEKNLNFKTFSNHISPIFNLEKKKEIVTLSPLNSCDRWQNQLDIYQTEREKNLEE